MSVVSGIVCVPGSASVLKCSPPGSVFPGAGYGPVAGGFKNGLLDRLSSGLPGPGLLIPGSGNMAQGTLLVIPGSGGSSFGGVAGIAYVGPVVECL